PTRWVKPVLLVPASIGQEAGQNGHEIVGLATPVWSCSEAQSSVLRCSAGLIPHTAVHKVRQSISEGCDGNHSYRPSGHDKVPGRTLGAETVSSSSPQAIPFFSGHFRF